MYWWLFFIEQYKYKFSWWQCTRRDDSFKLNTLTRRSSSCNGHHLRNAREVGRRGYKPSITGAIDHDCSRKQVQNCSNHSALTVRNALPVAAGCGRLIWLIIINLEYCTLSFHWNKFYVAKRDTLNIFWRCFRSPIFRHYRVRRGQASVCNRTWVKTISKNIKYVVSHHKIKY